MNLIDLMGAGLTALEWSQSHGLGGFLFLCLIDKTCREKIVVGKKGRSTISEQHETEIHKIKGAFKLSRLFLGAVLISKVQCFKKAPDH